MAGDSILILKRAKVTLYLAQESDSLGKDSELATTLVQGKNVVVLVPMVHVDKRSEELSDALAKDGDDELAHVQAIAFHMKDKEDKEIAAVVSKV